MTEKRSTAKTLHRAWELRQEPTPAESKLWAVLHLLRKDGVHFRRQHAIGPYITDFCSPRRKLIIEVDGGQHRKKGEYELERSAHFESKGYRLLRFWNSEVLNDIHGVMDVILREMEKADKK